MRISDWSSDVCSSDLEPGIFGERKVACHRLGELFSQFALAGAQHALHSARLDHLEQAPCVEADRVDQAIGLERERGAAIDRKSVVWGTSVAVRVDLGGRRIIKKKRDIQHI